MVRLTIALFYALLIAGGVTMVYPFLLMVATSVTSGADQDEYRLVPRYLYDDEALFAKYLAAKYETAGRAGERLYTAFGDLRVDSVKAVLADTPAERKYDPAYPARGDDFVAFRGGLPDDMLAGGWDHLNVMSLLHGRYRRWLEREVGGPAEISRRYHDEISDINLVYALRERPEARDWTADWNQRYRDYRRFKAEAGAAEPWLLVTVAGDSKYAAFARSQLASRPELWPIQFAAADPLNADVARRLDVGPLLGEFAGLSPSALGLERLKSRLAALGVEPSAGRPPADLLDLRLPTRLPPAAASADRQALLDDVVAALAATVPALADQRLAVVSEAALWEQFARTRWPLQLIGFDPARRDEVGRRFARFLRDRLDVSAEGESAGGDKLATLVALYNADGQDPPIAWRKWDEVTVPTFEQLQGRLKSHYQRFIELAPAADAVCAVPADWFVLDTVEQRWRDWVRAHYAPAPATQPDRLAASLWRARADDEAALSALNAAHGTSWTSIEQLRPPVLAAEQGEVVAHSGHWRWQFVSSNYAAVLDLILFHGDALANTFALIVGTIFLSLTVNPLAAYALSRFNLSYSHKVLLFLLATMAFPAEVAMIPNFLLIRDLGLLNTFGALLLPGAANGYAIFLLKGFFDTLPKELYEAAQLDGASELRMFYQITVPLCKPVFAFMALTAFTAAYGAFLFAMLTCQDPRMWTMMVWLYDLSNTVSGGVQVAAFTVAALPTLLVFVFCQNIIMRGIILPQMH